MCRLRVLPPVFAVFVILVPIPARAADAVIQVLQATCKVANRESTATGFLINRPKPGATDEQETILVTAAHVVEKMAGEDGLLVLRKAKDDGTYERVEFAFKVRAEGKPLWTKHPEADVAVMRVRLPDGLAVQPLPLTALATEEAVKNGALVTGQDVRIAGFPNQVEATPAGFPVLRRGAVASFPLTPCKAYKMFLVDYSVYFGDSGGPIFVATPGNGTAKSDAGPLIVGLLHGQMMHDEKTKLAYEERMQHHPMGLALVIHAEFIRQTIDMLK